MHSSHTSDIDSLISLSKTSNHLSFLSEVKRVDDSIWAFTWNGNLPNTSQRKSESLQMGNMLRTKMKSFAQAHATN